MIWPRVMPVNESLRSNDLSDEAKEEEEEGVHGDRPAKTSNRKAREGRR
jgi:hypothetical protein